MTTAGINARESRSERQPGNFYWICILAIVFGLFWMGHGVIGFFGPDVHTAYFETPACDDSLLRAAKEHLAPVCSVVQGTVSLFSDRDNKFSIHAFLSDKAEAAPHDAKVPGPYLNKLPWSDVKKDTPVFVQIFNEEGPDQKRVYVAAKVYNPATQELAKTDDVPVSKNGQAWADLRIASIIIGVAVALMFLGTLIRPKG